ncbi:single-stranded DNA-binding protein [Enemella evansiae]|uniref:Single-stranded DNA-binding protein n=1 Tax=Enemella evansiae TaxID=2016499 RepID=A0A255GLJ1_9ACTN|nr:single-stranded DNA-binding protein [Enemella evansiae]PFG65264.1 single-strand DNA-binding protein [Propionibacteriaceae bacterium ES.041]OYN99485.1 single-stranded DNA-binding protein [Enemella evansiae]OYO02382.1 single-stranded DNA-binding protein [Enemella evansiae]OYO16431.1 single-stranded DNA-binding protein [Enemella evansiae]TDO91831.1 single-strand binding protein [Enemella evansiae]
MAGETIITLVGNLTGDPELRFTPSGAAVANFTVASTPRNFDRQTNEWRDGEAMFINCSVWRQAAENVAESLAKGMRVIVQGRLKSRSYETREGERRTVFEIDVDEVGPALRYATAKVAKTSGGGGGGQGGYGGGGGQGGYGGGNSGGGQGGQGGYGGGQQQGGNSGGGDPWGNSGGGNNRSQGSDPWATQQSEEPPF